MVVNRRGRGGRGDNEQPEDITSTTPAPDLSNPSTSPGGRYDLSSPGVTPQMEYDYGQSGGQRGGRREGRIGGSGGSSYSEGRVRKYAESTNKEDAQRFAETTGRRSAINYILRMPKIRGTGLSNRGMAASSSRLGM